MSERENHEERDLEMTNEAYFPYSLATHEKQHGNPGEYTVTLSLPAIHIPNRKDAALVCTKASGIFVNPICVMQ